MKQALTNISANQTLTIDIKQANENINYNTPLSQVIIGLRI
jgi:hypothetical protein